MRNSSCQRALVDYNLQVRSTLKWLCLLALPALLCAGCGGISASRTVSPLDFLLPGILKNEPVTNCTNELATVNVKFIECRAPAEIASTR
jgi:hypothetical protein